MRGHVRGTYSQVMYGILCRLWLLTKEACSKLAAADGQSHRSGTPSYPPKVPPSEPRPPLFNKRLLFVTGKGGVGKSTLSIALGVVAARRGLRTIVAELSSQEHAQRTWERNGERFQ
jgi:Mrp family chromosome partitioning ATPase